MIKRIKGYKSLFESRVLKFKENRYQMKARSQLTNTDFTIISNNCWGGGVYEALGLSYASPTVGLFFYAPCYINFVKNLEYYVSMDLKFIDESKYNIANEARKGNLYPIGLINKEIEIHFLHYQSEEEARDKWNRRKSRINYNNLFFSLTDNDLCTINEIQIFDSLSNKKVFFSAKNIPGISSLVWLKKFEKSGKVGDLYSIPWQYRKEFNVVKWLNY